MPATKLGYRSLLASACRAAPTRRNKFKLVKTCFGALARAKAVKTWHDKGKRRPPTRKPRSSPWTNMPQLRSSPGRSRARVSHEEEGRRGTQCPFSRVPLEHIKLSWKNVWHHGTMPLTNHQPGSWSKKKSLARWHSAAPQRGSKAELGHPAGFAAGHRREKDYTNAPADGICFFQGHEMEYGLYSISWPQSLGVYIPSDVTWNMKNGTSDGI